MTTEFGAKLRLKAPPESACDGQLTVFRWAFNISSSDIPALAVAVGRAYVTDAMRLAYPAARVSDKIPPEESTTRTGDFGEMIAQGIYSTRMGRVVPFSKLQLAKPVAAATVQGPDSLCLTITQGEDVEPVIVEAKWRKGGTPSAVLDPIESSFKGLGEQYCVEAWAAGVQLMHAHQDHERHFAFTAAQHLGRLIDPKAPLPPHLRHAVAVVPEDRMPTVKIEERWSSTPPRLGAPCRHRHGLRNDRQWNLRSRGDAQLRRSIQGRLHVLRLGCQAGHLRSPQSRNGLPCRQ